MQKRNALMRGWMILAGILLGLCVVLGGFTLANGFGSGSKNAFVILHPASILLMSFFGMYYLFVGCKKNPGGKLLKIFFWLTALPWFVEFFNSTYMQETSLGVASIALRFAGACILAISNDLGEAKSKGIAGLVLVLSAADFVSLILRRQVYLLAWLGAAGGVVAGFALLILICAKYADKKARGSK